MYMIYVYEICIHLILLVSSLVDSYLHSFHILAIVNHDGVNLGVQIPSQGPDFKSLTCISGVGWLGHAGGP